MATLGRWACGRAALSLLGVLGSLGVPHAHTPTRGASRKTWPWFSGWRTHFWRSWTPFRSSVELLVYQRRIPMVQRPRCSLACSNLSTGAAPLCGGV